MNQFNAHQFIPLIQALAEGKRLQFFNPLYNAWADAYEFSFENLPHLYRIKPEILKYRRSLHKDHLTAYVANWYEYHKTETVEKSAGFIRWIDTEWQEVEL